MRLSRDDILKADDLPTEEVPVPEWGGEVLVRGLDGQGRDEFEASTMVLRGPPGKQQAVPDTANIRAKLVARCIIGDDGAPQFTQQDVAELGKKSAAALDRVFEVASRLSGLSDQDIEDLGKGSEITRFGDSASSSPASSDAPSRSFSAGSLPAS